MSQAERTQGGRSPAARRLGEVEDRFHRITENATDLIAEIDSGGRFLFVSPNCAEVLGYRAEQLVGRGIGDPVVLENLHPDDRERLLGSFLDALRGQREGWIEYRYRGADGSWRWFESRARIYRTEDGELRAVAISRDVTDRERALRELAQSEERYRVLVESTQDLVAELDAEGRVVFVSPSSEALLGFRPEELVGTTPFNWIHPSDVETLADAFLARLTREGRPRNNRVFRVRHRDGSWRWLQGGGVNYHTAEGELRIVAVCRDVSERLKADEQRRQLDERLRQAQKLESLGRMARGVAHDFNNLLTPILGDASMALVDLPPDSPGRARLERIQRAARRAARLTRQMLDYAGIGALDPEPLELSQLVRDMGQLLASAAPGEAELDYRLSDDLPTTRVDAAQIGQVLVNLVSNAREASEGAPEARVAVRTGRVELDREALSRHWLGPEAREGSYVFLEVEDSGSGMDSETLSRIFDPFFTTRFSGRGLGLAAALGIVRAHRGTIEIESSPGVGTRVRVCLPVAEEAKPAAEPDVGSWRCGATVLVADDDEGALDFSAEVLERAGLEVLRARDGREALALFRARADEVALVLLDRTMPSQGGEQALEGISRLRPEVPVVLMSGYSEPGAAGRRGVAAFLQKPFTPETLLARVREQLD